MAGAELEPTEREAVAALLVAARDALMDPRLDRTTVWYATGLIGQVLEVAAGDVRRGGRASLLAGAAVQLGEYLDQVAAGRLTGPFRTGREGGGS
jgi:hypothetical protein